MNQRTKLEYILGSIVLALLLLFAYQWHSKQVEVAVAQTKADADQHLQDVVNKELEKRDAKYDQDVKALQEKYSMLNRMTPSQIVEKVPVYIPQATAPIQIVGPDTPAAKIGDAIVPQVDIKPIATAILDGEKCKLDLGKCQADLGDWKEKYRLQADETAQWKKAAKGGSVLKRVGKVVLVLGIGAGIGYAAHR